MKVTPKRGVGFDDIAERIYRFNEVSSVYLMSGTYDLSIIIEGKSMNEVANFVSKKAFYLGFGYLNNNSFYIEEI